MAKEFVYEIRGFGGLAEDASQSSESPDTVNFTLTADRRLQKREGFRTVRAFEGGIRAIWSGILAGEQHCFVVESTRVWHGEGGFETMEKVGVLPGHDWVQVVEFAGKLYFLCGLGIRCFSPAEGYGEIVAYRPLVMAGSGPDGLGTPVEEVNLLGGRCRQRFTPKEGRAIYHLCLENLDSVDYVTLNGEELSPERYEAHTEGGLVALELGADGAPDSLEIGFTKRVAENEQRVTRCRYASVFGGNNQTALFLWGNPDYPALRLHSGYADGVPDGAYFPETHYVQVGDGSPITGILRHYDSQMIFTAQSAYTSTSQREVDEFSRVRISYPVQLISGAAGNLATGSACLMGNTPVSVTAGGVCRWQRSNLRDETNADVFTKRIGRGLDEARRDQLRLFYHSAKQRLYLWSDRGLFYVYDVQTDSFWRFQGWEPGCFFEETATGALYFGTANGGLCLVGGSDDDGAPIEAYWYSRELDLGAPSRTKSLFWAAVSAKAGAQNELCLQWAADAEGHSLPVSGHLCAQSKERLLDFARFRFDRLSFLTAYHMRNLCFRLRLRRFRKLRLCLRECSREELLVDGIRLYGRTNDKRV